MLEMVTREDDFYSEYSKTEEVLEKVKAGIKPVALRNVTDPQVKEFIDKCLAPADKRPSANDLLNDPFLTTSVSGTSTTRTNSSLTESEGLLISRLLQFVKEMDSGNRKFKLQGRIKDNAMIQMKLSITDNAMIANFDLELSPEIVTARQFVMENIATQIHLSRVLLQELDK